jgi:hypothetical protein
LARKGAKSRRRITGLRSKATKVRSRVGRMRKPRADLEQQLEKYRHELVEAREHLAAALERQTATSEVLRVISSSPGELEAVFQAMLANAVRICEARFGNLYLHERGALRVVASHNVPRAFAEARRRGPFRPAPGSAFGKLIRTKIPVSGGVYGPDWHTKIDERNRQLVAKAERAAAESEARQREREKAELEALRESERQRVLAAMRPGVAI